MRREAEEEVTLSLTWTMRAAASQGTQVPSEAEKGQETLCPGASRRNSPADAFKTSKPEVFHILQWAGYCCTIKNCPAASIISNIPLDICEVKNSFLGV